CRAESPASPLLFLVLRIARPLGLRRVLQLRDVLSRLLLRRHQSLPLRVVLLLRRERAPPVLLHTASSGLNSPIHARPSTPSSAHAGSGAAGPARRAPVVAVTPPWSPPAAAPRRSARPAPGCAAAGP